MNLKSQKHIRFNLLLVIILIFPFYGTNGQQTVLSPLSYWVFVPSIYNPAIAGSRDFLSIGLNAAFQGSSNSQLVSGNTRISKTKSGYFSSPDIVEFKNIGVGGSVFRDKLESYMNTGFSAFGSYQIPLSTKKLSFLSFGASVKGIYYSLDNDTVDTGNSQKTGFYPDLDLGVYYYGTNFFTGLSAVNIFDYFKNRNNRDLSENPVPRQYFFTAGYKILLSKDLNIVLEPSVFIPVNDSTINNISENINPIIKLYLDDFCLGTSFSGNGKITFFSQFRYPKFYIGAYYELEKKTPYFKKSPLVELTIGLNIQPDKSRLSHHSKW